MISIKQEAFHNKGFLTSKLFHFYPVFKYLFYECKVMVGLTASRLSPLKWGSSVRPNSAAVAVSVPPSRRGRSPSVLGRGFYGSWSELRTAHRDYREKRYSCRSFRVYHFITTENKMQKILNRGFYKEFSVVKFRPEPLKQKAHAVIHV